MGAGADRQMIRSLGTVGRAFFGGFQRLREVQRHAIPPIRSGDDVLVTAATATGKTEAILAPLLFRTRERMPVDITRIRMLLIAPTRALVNDLARRLETPIARLGLTWGLQTSDRRDKNGHPFLLITTPESFDSMLVRDGRRHGGRIVDHLLAGVAAVYIDEAHLFDGTARGDQLCWLLARLRRLGKLDVETAATPITLQACAGSATVSDPEELARRLLGPGAISIRVTGTREIDVFGDSPSPGWTVLDPSAAVTSVRDQVHIVPTRSFAGSTELRLWQAMSRLDDTYRIRKVLVFVPSRRICDTLSAHLAETLPKRRDLRVLAHHGSLSRSRREDAERSFGDARDAVLVATTTMEVGVDIGDVDLVALVGAPPGTRSLLQRIGRAGRRLGRTRVLPLPRTTTERAALASMLISARDGRLEQERYARRWSVFVQQTASFVAQAKPVGRRRSDLLALAQDVWPEQRPVTANAIVNDLLKGDFLMERHGRIALGEPWANLFDTGERGMHANLDATYAGTPVVDASTGEVVAHVAEAVDDQTLALAGQRWHARAVDGEILLRPTVDEPAQDGVRYASRRGPTGREYAMHVQRGFGLGKADAPLLDLSSGPVWLHFGGSAYQALLCGLLPSVYPAAGLSGLAIRGKPDDTILAELSERTDALQNAVEEHFEVLEPALSPGPYQRRLPEQCRRLVVADLFDLSAFRRWLFSRRVWQLTDADPRYAHLQTMLQEI